MIVEIDEDVVMTEGTGPLHPPSIDNLAEQLGSLVAGRASVLDRIVVSALRWRAAVNASCEGTPLRTLGGVVGRHRFHLLDDPADGLWLLVGRILIAH